MERLDKITMLKNESDAVILAHNYQSLEILKIADFIGDSVELARKAQKTKKETIIVCGVHFMAESAKILNPERKVFLANENAGCPMADMAIGSEVRKKKQEFPNAAVVSYVNSSAEVKAESDVCCTSANAIKIVSSLPQDEVIFIPDFNLADYVSENADKKIIPWGGYCYVHHSVSLGALLSIKNKYPKARVLAHPECPKAIRKKADGVYSTSGMIREVSRSKLDEFIIITEPGLRDLLEWKFPKKKFYSIVGKCMDMKKTKISDIVNALEGKRKEIEISENVLEKAKKALEKMIEIS